ncbi:TetR/AcrR family transcriptional regulator [Nocardia farcinica]|uniref:TetR/AcrR family transcriptional regulator n=1 Tax=Nocardia farcinica TaxID=37329 RepID=UPI001893C857|nr:TetR/AcrR family transcriptional regulator [Nocardia farcinica]MBF6139424.1 TetR/AcrR family transcriptional regulator [Nocardia farcinica]MBF6383965.1 TetR/AcrR family transcriptional regulator [Nocardia farcinica]
MSRVVIKEQYFDTALEVLAELGFKGLNIGLLCRRLGVTSGSFYHHFGSWQGFVDALLEHWENRQIRILRTLNFNQGNPHDDIAAMADLALGLHHAAEAAIRAWAANDESVNLALKRVDESRRRTVHKAVKGIVGDDATTAVLTSMGMAMLIGCQQIAAGGDDVSLHDLLGQYQRLIYSYTRR